MLLFLFWGCLVSSEPVDSGQSIVEPSGESPVDADLERLQNMNSDDLPQAENPCRTPVLGFVEHVVDGDTAYIETAYGEEKVRFIGINTPELGYDDGPDECFSLQARQEAVLALENKWVWLSFDRTCQDFYERTLAYASVGLGVEDFFQRRMLRRGFAQHFPFDSTPAFSDLFDEDERFAQEMQQGGWLECAWQ